MRKFASVKSFDQLVFEAKHQGYKVNTKPFDEGSDWLYLNKNGRDVAVNIFNGTFFVYQNRRCIATEISAELEQEAWYTELLELLYKPLPVFADKEKTASAINTDDFKGV